jgi:hypothetical protein
MKRMMWICLPSLIWAACTTDGEPYYAKDGAVSVLSLSVDGEDGNMGGQIVEISGSGFGLDVYEMAV